MYESNGVDKDLMKYNYGGIVTDFKFGNIATFIDGATCIEIKEGHKIGWLLVEAEGDIRKAKELISEAFHEATGERLHSREAVRTLKEIVEESFISERHSCVMIGAFSLLCILLTIMALTALSSYFVHMRTQDIAIRKVLGVSRQGVFWQTVWGFIGPVLIGAAVAIPFAYLYIGQWLQTYPVRIGNSAAIYLCMLGLVLSVTLCTVTFQALHLMRTNPAEVLKKE